MFFILSPLFWFIYLLAYIAFQHNTGLCFLAAFSVEKLFSGLFCVWIWCHLPKHHSAYAMCHPGGCPLFNPCGRRLQAYSTGILTPWADTGKWHVSLSFLSILSSWLCTPPMLSFSFIICIRLVKFCRDLMPPTLSTQSQCSPHILLLAMFIASCPSRSTGTTEHCQNDSTSFQHHCPSSNSVRLLIIALCGAARKKRHRKSLQVVFLKLQRWILAHEKAPTPVSESRLWSSSTH